MCKITFCLLIFIISSCADFRRASPVDKKRFKKDKQARISEDARLNSLIKRKISRLGKYSTVTDGDITTERFLRKKGETILTLEKGELRTETEKSSSGRIITKTWQEDVMTTFSVTTPGKNIMVLLDKKGHFVHKIITLDDNEAPECWYYNGKAVVPITTTECVGLIPGFD